MLLKEQGSEVTSCAWVNAEPPPRMKMSTTLAVIVFQADIESCTLCVRHEHIVAHRCGANYLMVGNCAEFGDEAGAAKCECNGLAWRRESASKQHT